MIAEEPMSEVESKKQRLEKKKAMLEKVKSLGMDNPIVKGVVKENKKDFDKAHDQWRPISMLTSEAFEQFQEGDLGFDKAVVSLAAALMKLAGKKKVD